MAEYRALREGEFDEVLALWTTVFGVPAWLFQSNYDSTEGRTLEHTRVAVENGVIVASVDMALRTLRWTDGEPALVGGIANVATLPEARQKGHSGRLLEQAIAVMQEAGCKWSFLFTGVNAHYERYGWRTMSISQKKGHVSPETCRVNGWLIDRYDPVSAGDLLPQMRKIYESYNASRPLSCVRNQGAWDIAIPVRLEQPNRRAFLARREANQPVAAYLLDESMPWGNSLIELCYLPGAEAAIPDLFEAFRHDDAERGALEWTIEVAFDDAVQSALPCAFPDLQPAVARHSMARPIAEGVTYDDLEELFRAPGARWWGLDNF